MEVGTERDSGRLWAVWDEKYLSDDGEREEGEGSRGPVTVHRKKGKREKKVC